MAKSADETTLTRELVSTRLFKASQGKVVRQVTAVAIVAAGLTLAWRVREVLLSGEGTQPALRLGVPVLIAAGIAWLAFRLVNWPTFANFLIQVEAEMDKVTWASWDYLRRATAIVLVTMVLLGIYLFSWDILWQMIFSAIGFLEM